MQQPTGDARRTSLANERTQLAWWRTGLTALAVAIAVGRVLPDLNTDAEQWPYTAVGAAFAIYGVLGFRIARKARSPFLQLVAIGLTFTTVLTAYLHIGVVIGLLPTTGLTLPFVSYGRSNLVLTLLFTGILVNIGSSRERVLGVGATNPLARPHVEA